MTAIDILMKEKQIQIITIMYLDPMALMVQAVLSLMDVISIINVL